MWDFLEKLNWHPLICVKFQKAHVFPCDVLFAFSILLMVTLATFEKVWSGVWLMS